MSEEQGLNRRDFLKTASIGAISAGAAATAASAQDAKLEHRNEKPEMMRYKRLGRTNMNVSVIGFGAMFISADQNNARIIEMAIDRGVNYVDTAWAYTKQTSEAEIGRLLSSKRDKFFLTTKASPYGGLRNKLRGDVIKQLSREEQQGLRDQIMKTALAQGAKEADLKEKGRNPSKDIFRRVQVRMENEKVGDKINTKELIAGIEKSLEESLTRLKTDHVDVLFLPHGIDMPEDARYPDVRGAWEKIKKAGKARFLGAPNHSNTVATYAACIESGIYDILMPCYCPLNYNSPEDQDSILAKAKAADLGVIAMKTLGSSKRDERYAKQLGGKTYAEKMNELIKGEGTPLQKSIAWVLTRPHIDMALVGFSNQQELDEDLGALKVKLG